MVDLLFQAICQVGIFMICAQAVVHFRPKESYEKYLKLLVSVMVLIQIFLPMGSFLLGDGREDAADALEQFRQELERSMQEASEYAIEADEVLEKMTLEEVRRQLEETQEKEAQSREREAAEGGEQPEGSRQEDGRDGHRIEIDSDAIEPVTINPIEPIQDDLGEE